MGRMVSYNLVGTKHDFSDRLFVWTNVEEREDLILAHLPKENEGEYKSKKMLTEDINVAVAHDGCEYSEEDINTALQKLVDQGFVDFECRGRTYYYFMV